MNKHIIFLLIIVGWCACPFFGVQAQTTYVGWCERAAAAIEGDSLTQAQEYIRQALRLEPSNPNNALLFSNLGTIQRRQGQYELALESYQLALNLSPMSVPIPWSWGVMMPHGLIIRKSSSWSPIMKKPS